MSELKAGVIHTPHDEGMTFVTDSDTISVNERETEFYLKSEADKVIAEKDKEIQRLENLCESYRIDCDNLAISEANAYKEIERDNKRIRHHKYKRCLDMAKICENKLGTVVKPRWWDKWRRRWLELAEKFKPNNSTAQ